VERWCYAKHMDGHGRGTYIIDVMADRWGSWMVVGVAGGVAGGWDVMGDLEGELSCAVPVRGLSYRQLKD
jgi:hypothetical protein